MGRPGTNAPPVRGRLVRVSVVAAAGVAVASLAHSELVASSRWSALETPDPGIVLAAKVASSSTPTAILIRVTAPTGQLPGVVYTVTRVTRGGTTTICTGRAPLRCTDPVGTPGTAVSYTVSSTLDGLRSATTSVDVATAPRPDRTVAAHRTLRDPGPDDAGQEDAADATTAERAQAATTAERAQAAAATPTASTSATSSPLSASASGAVPMSTGAPVSQSAAAPTTTVATTGHVPGATHSAAAPTSTVDASSDPAIDAATRTTSAP